jgi:hypothetical protein
MRCAFPITPTTGLLIALMPILVFEAAAIMPGRWRRIKLTVL